jgi:DHA1 family multidrug resistance protein-like MFS transporter
MRPVYTLFAAVFVMSIGFGIMTPAVSLFSVLGFGVNEWELGILGGLVSLPYTIGSIVFGRYSDRVGRKPLILGGQCIYAGVALAYIIAPGFAFLAILRLLEGLCFSLIWPASEAWVGDLSHVGDRLRLIGYYSVAWSAGYMLGPFLLGVMVTYTSIQYSFILAASLVAASIPILLAVRNSRGDRKELAREEKKAGKIPTKAVLFAMVVWGIAQLAYFFLLPAYTIEVGFPAAYAGYLIGTVALFRTIIFVGYSRLVKTLRDSILSVGMLLIATAMLVTWLAQDFLSFALASSMLGLAFGMIYAYSLSHVLERPAKGFYAGLFESAIGIGQIAGPLSMGYIGFVLSPSTPYLAMGVLGIASAVAIAFALFRGQKKAP